MTKYNWREIATNKADESLVYIDGEALQSLGIDVILSSEDPYVPGMNNHVVNIPQMHGAHDMGADLKPRVFSINCIFPRKKDYTSLKKLSRRFSTLFFDQYGRPKDVELRFGDEPEKWYMARITKGVSPELIARRSIITVELTAFDPYAYAPADYYDPDFVARYDEETDYDDGETEYTNQTGTPFDNPRQYAGVFNYSHYATPFSFVIEGYVHKPKITNLTSGKSAQLNVTVEKNEKLYFDSRLQTVWKISSQDDQHFWLTPVFMMEDYNAWDKINEYNEMSGQFIELLSGGNTLLFEGGNPDAHIDFDWEHRFL